MKGSEQKLILTSNGNNNKDNNIDHQYHEDHDLDDDGKKEPPLMALNHVSRLCRDVVKSIELCTKVSGMVLIERPSAFDFDGAWLFNYGVGIHLVQSKDEDRLPHDTQHFGPHGQPYFFSNMKAMEKTLKEYNLKYIKRAVEDEENGTSVDQLFFDDPDGFTIEICNCENLKLVPAGSLGKIKLPFDRHNPPVEEANDADGDHNHEEHT